MVGGSSLVRWRFEQDMLSTPYSSTPNGCSLAYILNKDDPASRWDGDRPSFTYRNIIRFILQELFKHENDLGYLNPNYIFVTSGEAKVAQPCNVEREPRALRVEFISLIVDMLGKGNNPKRLELNHFIRMARKPGVTFQMLFNHSLLQSTYERYFSPNRVVHHMNDKEKGSWREDYRKFKPVDVDFNSVIETSKYKVGLESVLNELNEKKGNQITKYKNQRKKGNQITKYKYTIVDVLDFSKNVGNHINEHLERLGEKRVTGDEIENELTRMFPTRLIDLYEFLVSKRSRISMAFLSRH